jgi:DNA-binding NarL/FixJ family response regulator
MCGVWLNAKCNLCDMTNAVPHHIFIIDSHPWVLRALSQLIQIQTDFIVSQMSNDWRTLLADGRNPHPCVILLDWESPGIGRVTLNMIRAVLAHVKVIAMGVWLSSRRSALAAGVDGFINKTDPPEQVLAVLLRVGQLSARETA